MDLKFISWLYYFVIIGSTINLTLLKLIFVMFGLVRFTLYERRYPKKFFFVRGLSYGIIFRKILFIFISFRAKVLFFALNIVFLFRRKFQWLFDHQTIKIYRLQNWAPIHLIVFICTLSYWILMLFFSMCLWLNFPEQYLTRVLQKLIPFFLDFFTLWW